MLRPKQHTGNSQNQQTVPLTYKEAQYWFIQAFRGISEALESDCSITCEQHVTGNQLPCYCAEKGVRRQVFLQN